MNTSRMLFEAPRRGGSMSLLMHPNTIIFCYVENTKSWKTI